MHNGEKYPIGVINAEMTSEQLIERIGCNLKSVDNYLFVKNPKYITDNEFSDFVEAMDEVLEMQLNIYDSNRIDAIVNKINYWVETKGVKCVFVDYLQLLRVPDSLLRNYVTEVQKINYCLEELRLASKNLKVPIILYSQMNREILANGAKREPNLGDLKGSGNIEESAYQIAFLHRPEYYNPKEEFDENGESIKGLLYFKIAKHRGGKLETIKLKINLNTYSISSWEQSSFMPIIIEENKFVPIAF